MGLSVAAISELLDAKATYYNKHWFIEEDPLSIPHLFTAKEDREIAGFLAATIAWGQRPVIIRNAKLLMQWMDYQPYDYIRNAGAEDISCFMNFKHRTFNGIDCVYFIKALQNIYTNLGGLEEVFTNHWEEFNGDAALAISAFRNTFFSFADPGRSAKHVSNPIKGSSAKRLNMYLRWMVRKDEHAVDFGIWKGISPSQLSCPLDVHTGNVARRLGILKRRSNDWKAVAELTTFLKSLDPVDPVKYDFALFGLGMYEDF